MTKVEKTIETLINLDNLEVVTLKLKELANDIVRQTCDLGKNAELDLEFTAECYKNYIDENAIYDLLEEDEEGGLVDVDVNEELDKIFAKLAKVTNA